MSAVTVDEAKRLVLLAARQPVAYEMRALLDTVDDSFDSALAVYAEAIRADDRKQAKARPLQVGDRVKITGANKFGTDYTGHCGQVMNLSFPSGSELMTAVEVDEGGGLRLFFPGQLERVDA